MMKAPSIKALTETFRDLTTAEAKTIRKLAKAADDRDAMEDLVDDVPAAAEYVRSLYRDNWRSYDFRVSVALHAIDTIVEGHGVEALGDEEGDNWIATPDYEYINMGDSYASTLIYDRAKDRLFIGSWGDLVEARERGRSRKGNGSALANALKGRR